MGNENPMKTTRFNQSSENENTESEIDKKTSLFKSVYPINAIYNTCKAAFLKRQSNIQWFRFTTH